MVGAAFVIYCMRSEISDSIAHGARFTPSQKSFWSSQYKLQFTRKRFGLGQMKNANHLNVTYRSADRKLTGLARLP